MRLLLAAMLMLAACLGARPAAAANERYVVMWTIVPQDELVPVGWFKPYTTITSVRLIPKTLLVLDADVKGADGALLMRAGTELIGLSSELTIGCTMQTGKASILLNRYVCLVDSDKDGRFDQTFNRGTQNKYLFTGAGKVPGKRAAVAPVGYQPRDPMTATFQPRLYLQYGWFASLVGELIFQTCFEESDKSGTSCLSPWATVKAKTMPAELESYGGKFRVEGKEENRVQVRMLSAFDPQPFFLLY